MTRQALVFEAEFNPDEEPIPIHLVLTNKVSGASRREEFHAIWDPGAGGDLAVVATYRRDPKNPDRVFTDLAGIKLFFHRVLVEGDYERLEALLDDKAWTVPMSMLGAVYNALVAEYAARPSQPSRVSSIGPPETGSPSTEPASSTAST